jgi:hypothetical protein
MLFFGIIPLTLCFGALLVFSIHALFFMRINNYSKNNLDDILRALNFSASTYCTERLLVPKYTCKFCINEHDFKVLNFIHGVPKFFLFARLLR